ncbi:MAG: hypothetical protein LBQ88_04530, partial [Treponema sp.]|nr:hypothetical protein [Treponema sp.]
LGYVPFANNPSGVEPAVRGVWQFLLRGLERVGTEWDLVTLAYDVKRLFSLGGGDGRGNGHNEPIPT